MAVGRKVGPYEVVRELGRGGMGVVYEVRHPEVPRRLALKLSQRRLASPTALARLEREARLLARVDHRCVLRVHSLDEAPEGPYLVTELVEGTSLEEVVRAVGEGRPLEARRVAALLRDLADGLAALHALGILHRDLKPSNVMVRPDGSPVLLDFGLARELDASRLTETGALVGTPAYMAPEQVGDDVDRSSLDARVDVYGLGAVLFACLHGRAPFVAETLVALMYKVVHEAPEWAPQPEREGRWLVAVGEKAMAKDRDARYATALELRDDLDRVARGEEPLASLASARRARERAVRSARQRRLLARLAIAGATVVLLAGAVAIGRAAGLRARGREALAAARRYDVDVLHPWGLGLADGAPPGDPDALERHAARLRATLAALSAQDAGEAAALLERLDAARHALAGTVPDRPAGAHAWAAAGVAALRREDLGGAEAAAVAAEKQRGGRDLAAWIRCELLARREPYVLLRRVAESEAEDPRRRARPALARALEGAYLAALREALRGRSDRLAEVIGLADRLGLDLERVRPAKAALLGDARLVEGWRAELERAPGRAAEPALEALERIARAHDARPRVAPADELVRALRGRLEDLAREAQRALRPSADAPEERARAVARLLRFEATCAWPLGVDTRLDPVEDVVAEFLGSLTANASAEMITRAFVAALRLGRSQRTVVFGIGDEACDPATLDALERSGDPLAPVVRRFGQRPFDDAGLEEAMRALPDRAIQAHYEGELLVLAAWLVLEDATMSGEAGRFPRVRQLVEAAREHLDGRHVALARSYEVEACALVDLRGDVPAALELLRDVEPRFLPAPDAPSPALDAWDRVCMWRAWVEHLQAPDEAGPVERARAVAERAQARSGAFRREARMMVSRMLVNQGKGVEALEALEPITAEDRQDPALLIAEAVALHAKGDRRRSAEAFEALQARFGHIPAVRHHLAQARRALR